MVARGLSMAHDDDEFEVPISAHDDLVETLTIFDDVFVPYERVFLLGEYEYAGAIANTFASVNRQGYLGTEVGRMRLFVGAAQRIAELNGVGGRRAHPRQGRPDDPAGAHDLGARPRLVDREHVAATATRCPTRSRPTRASSRAWRATTWRRGCCWRSPAARWSRPRSSRTCAPRSSAATSRSTSAAPTRTRRGSACALLKFIRDIAASEYSGYWNTEIIHGSGSPAAEMLADLPRARPGPLQGAGRPCDDGQGRDRRGVEGAGRGGRGGEVTSAPVVHYRSRLPSDR